MNDIKIPSVQNIQEHHPAERTQPKPGIGSQVFERTLETTMRDLSEIEAAAANALRPGETKAASIQDEIKTSNEQMRKMMKAQQDLAMLFQNLPETD